MKNKFLLTVMLLIGMVAQAQTVTPTSDEVLKPVYANAAAAKKKVLLIFHASWCGWCKKMDASLADASVKAAIDKNYEITHLTVYENGPKKALENPGALELLTKFGGAEKGLPYWVVLDADGNKLADSQYKPGENTGCPASAEEVAHFSSALRKTSAMTDDELKRVEVRFRKNEQ